MSEDEDVPTFAVALGRRLRELRLAGSVTSESVADAARPLGARWDRSTVSRIESGDRQVSASELFILAEAMACSVSDVLPVEPCWLTDGIFVHEGGLRQMLTEGHGGMLDLIGMHGTIENLERQLNAANRRADAIESEHDASYSEATRKASSRLGHEPWLVLLAARKLWRHGLDEERDLRTGVVEGESLRARQARRGHVTRQLVDELRPTVEALATYFADLERETD